VKRSIVRSDQPRLHRPVDRRRVSGTSRALRASYRSLAVPERRKRHVPATALPRDAGYRAENEHGAVSPTTTGLARVSARRGAANANQPSGRESGGSCSVCPVQSVIVPHGTERATLPRRAPCSDGGRQTEQRWKRGSARWASIRAIQRRTRTSSNVARRKPSTTTAKIRSGENRGRWAIEGRVRGSDRESRRGHPRLTPVVSERTNRTPACDTLSHHRATGRQGEDGRRDTVIGESEGYPVRSHMSQRPLIAEQLRKRRSAACPPARGSGTA